MRILVNEAPVLNEHGTCKPCPTSASAQRVDQANGYKPKNMLTRMGDINFEVPQVRNSGFYPSALERGSRSEQSMNLALAEMYVQGVSTRLRLTVLQKLNAACAVSSASPATTMRASKPHVRRCFLVCPGSAASFICKTTRRAMSPRLTNARWWRVRFARSSAPLT